jgi:putative flippase GtrA
MDGTERNGMPAILIPGFSGGPGAAVAFELASMGFPVIAVCEPGDAAAAELAQKAGCSPVEAPKENALRAGLMHFQKELPGSPGVVYADLGDGYSVTDILAVAYVFSANPENIVIASRSKNGALNGRERAVKAVGGRVFIVHGRTVRDPWAGLVGLPAKHMPDFIGGKGSGRAAVFNILLLMQHHGIQAISVPVGAAYKPEGSSPTDRVKDILRILFLPFKFISASMTATGCDYLIFLLFLYLIYPGHWVFAMLIGRTAGGVTGYFLNRDLVFRHKNDTWRKELKSAFQFVLLFLFNLGASLSIVYLLHDVLLINEVAARLVTDAFLFIISYTVQREIIFRRKAPSESR